MIFFFFATLLLYLKKELKMSFFNKIEIQDCVSLLRSQLEFLDQTAYLSLIFNFGQLTLKSTDLISVSDSLICFSIEKRNGTIRINNECSEEIRKLQLLFKQAADYE